jgi:AmmeMemoRadiSam system protein B/AmmeMemoRadiSam system protein A
MDKHLNKSDRRKHLLHLPTLGVCVLGLLLVCVCKKESPTPSSMAAIASPGNSTGIRQNVVNSPLAGSWYPADAAALKKQIDDLFEKPSVKPIDNIIALILPHAGYRYSGPTAAMALKSINRKYKRVVIIGPSHRVPMEEVLSVSRATAYKTPLGQVPLDVDFINKLLKFPVFQNVPETDQYEHSVQIEVPLLQHCQDGFKLVPIVAGQCSMQTIDKAAGILSSLIDNETLVIASSDFVHYGPNYDYVPFKQDIPEQLKKLDMGAFEHISKLDGPGFYDYRRKTRATICGFIPITILLTMLDKSAEAHLVNYATSGQEAGDYTNSVSYLSVAFSGAWQTRPEAQQKTATPILTDEDKKQLLLLARKTMVYALKNRRVPDASDLGIEISDAMRPARAAFVTLNKNGALRGCIGDIFPRQPLYKSVIANAINACVNDRRFMPVSEDELKDITIEISALTIPAPIDSPDQIRIGIDGVVLNKNGRSAVFLPQVAPEQGWNISEMLTHLSMKAGLSPDAWKQGASFLVFQADVFGENEK